ncbi:hypothetical protein K7711_19210 [Nocardia sp. CA2R105]|uniref:hypothetical protein n=1 Tax=Nocardia coffeae TaxID=2873381 RepID=UPI001CA6F172|nr:hypothetical protein [Nocardia coffeae]MBY8858616.1 hypothetical protein [Nocardia coffeae]
MQLLQRIHALAAAGTAITHDLADSAWPSVTVALWQTDIQRLNQRCEEAEHQAHEVGVPRELTTMAWLAGHCDTEWTPAEPEDPTLGLRSVVAGELLADAGQLHNMAAVLVSHEFQPGAHRDSVKAEQLVLNMAALFKQTSMRADLIDVSDSDWESLWDLPRTAQQHYLTPFLGPEAREHLDWAWSEYTDADLETTVLRSIEQLESRTELHDHAMAHPRTARSGKQVAEVAVRLYDNALRQLNEEIAADIGAGLAVDAVLPDGTDRGWEPGGTPSGIADPVVDSVPEVEP